MRGRHRGGRDPSDDRSDFVHRSASGGARAQRREAPQRALRHRAARLGLRRTAVRLLLHLPRRRAGGRSVQILGVVHRRVRRVRRWRIESVADQGENRREKVDRLGRPRAAARAAARSPARSPSRSNCRGRERGEGPVQRPQRGFAIARLFPRRALGDERFYDFAAAERRRRGRALLHDVRHRGKERLLALPDPSRELLRQRREHRRGFSGDDVGCVHRETRQSARALSLDLVLRRTQPGE
mmetsp:Transcript_8924/g.36091  ORF Transcript_8924/g.36091 Transcript_8924/m.36091 type:complete len:241 (-) Transcript_8924:3374-4096(-)